MEVADQWRREWAGTAEYGRVTEGGVTRQIARAMEVLHASAPGARMRVMRAAYHSTAGPGAPAASFMLHSSRRVISSGFNLLESPTNPIKPLEISSTPLESSPESITENYKVTEPDDFEISQPSKWRSSKAGSSIRMPSEESSSTDNASIIDLDPRSSRNLHRKYSYDSESSDIQFGRKNSSRASPLLDPPVTLSTLKYKSLLSGSHEWNTRRKSYSFEDASPINETILERNDTLAMESSTDSGICKSSEIVNEHVDDSTHTKILTPNERKINNHDESFKDWLSRNRINSHYKSSKFKTYREHEIVLEDPIESNITVQATGKVSITLPVTIGTDDDKHLKKNYTSEDSDRKVKKVEFCKTELHFAAETGKVNIIATDEKPPPSNDFRKRRSAFVPMQDMIDKPITLFGEKMTTSDLHVIGENSSIFNISNGELGETDENTAATKSILKNKIPKPKPYLLGENMGFGLSDDYTNKDFRSHDSALTAVSLVNKQLEIDRHRENELKPIFLHDEDSDSFKNNVVRTIHKGPLDVDSCKQEGHITNYARVEKSIQNYKSIDKKDVSFIKNKFNTLQISPVQRRAKTRELRQSDLTYFGVDNDRNQTDRNSRFENKVTSSDTSIEDILHSVKLIQQVSNSVCNSEVESDDGPDYQNVPINLRYAPIPAPRLRSKYDEKSSGIHEIKVLRPIIEKENEDLKDVNKLSTRRSKLRRQEEAIINRSLSAPPKYLRNSIERPRRHGDRSPRSSKYESIKENSNNDVPNTPTMNRKSASADNNPIYVNLSLVREKLDKKTCHRTAEQNNLKITQKKYDDGLKIEQKTGMPKSNHKLCDRKKSVAYSDPPSGNSLRKENSTNKHSLTRQAEKSGRNHHKPNNDIYKSRNAHESRDRKHSDQEKISNKKEDYRSRSIQRRSHNKNQSEKAQTVTRPNESPHQTKNSNDESKQQRNSSKDKLSSKRNIHESSHELEANPSELQSTTVQSKIKGNDFNQKSNGHRTNKKSEYVINYDDKNGTVSSVTKIRSNPVTPKRKKSKETSKDKSKTDTLKHKTVNLNKIALLQIEDHQGESNGLSYEDRKGKTKVHVQRSCQVL